MLSFLSEASGDPHLLLSGFVSLFVKLHQSSNVTVSLETLVAGLCFEDSL